jgi:prefoldin subunit 1
MLQAFQDLQMKMIQTTQQMKIAEAQVETLKRKIAHARLVDQEVAALPEDTKVYQGVGRM